MWPNKKVPEANSNVNVPPEWRVLLDIDVNNLGYLEVEGDLLFDDRREFSKLSAEKIWVKRGDSLIY